MANWKALNWAESLTAGGPIVRAVLDKIALRVDDKFELYSSAPRIAALCELSPKPMRKALDALEAKGIITVIRRIRANRAEGVPVILLNHPEAPHLNGKPVVLDYQGSFLYPQAPQALAETGIAWISANTPGQVHPKDQLAGGVVGETRGGWSERPGGVVGETTPGVVGETTLNPLPRISTHHHGPSAGAAGDDDGRSSTEVKRTDEVRERAQALLGSLRMPKGKAFRPHAAAVEAVATALEAGHSEDAITGALMDGVEDYRSPAAGVTANVRDLSGVIARREAHSATQGTDEAAASSVPPRCGQCDARDGDPVHARQVEDPSTGAVSPCPRCHPKGIAKGQGRESVSSLAVDAAAAIGLSA